LNIYYEELLSNQDKYSLTDTASITTGMNP